LCIIHADGFDPNLLSDALQLGKIRSEDSAFDAPHRLKEVSYYWSFEE
jgi:hypothetical protein